MVNSVDSIYMFGKEADIMRMLRSDDQNRWFDEKLAVLWCSDHCHTFHSAWIVNYTENKPLPVNSRSRVNMFDKGADTMRMLRSEDQNRWFDLKTCRFVMFFHCRTFHSAPIVNCTENGPLPVSSRSRVNMFDKGADTMRMFRAKRQTGRILTSSDGRQKRTFGQPPISPAMGGI